MADKKPDRLTVFNRLFKFLRLGLDKSQNQIRPTERSIGSDGRSHWAFMDMPLPVQKFWDYWMTQCHDDATSFENRELLYNDLDMIFLNQPLLVRGKDLTRDEVYQADANFKTIGIDASPRVRDYLMEFHDKIGLEQHIPGATDSIVRYGNAGWVLGTDDSGINRIVPIHIFDLVDRIEFSAHKLRKQLSDVKSTVFRMSNSQKMKLLIDSVLKTQNLESYLESFLFGYQIGDFIIPPWKFIHFRNLVNESPFAPFGEPFFLHSIAPYRQYDAAMTLQVAARSARFPIFKHELILDGVPPSDKLAHAVRFMNLLENSGMHQTRKEEFGIGERVVTIKGLYEFSQETPDIDIGRMDDVDILRDDLVLSTGLPRNFLDPNNGSFGNSGIALSQQFRPFGRRVYRIQQILLEGISQMDKIQLILSGKFSEEEIDFQLTMPYPESQIDRDSIGAQSDLLDLANKIMDTVGQRFVGDPNALLPPELVKQILQKITPYDPQILKQWMDTALVSRIDLASGNNAPAAGGGGAEAGGGAGPGGGGGGAPAGGPGAGEEAPAEGEEEAAPEEEETLPEEESIVLGGEAQESTGRTSLIRSQKPSKEQVRKFFEGMNKKILRETVGEVIFKESNKVMREGSTRGRHFYSSKLKPVNGGFDPMILLELRNKQIAQLKEDLDERDKLIAEDIKLFSEETENELPEEKKIFTDIMKRHNSRLKWIKEERDRKIRARYEEEKNAYGERRKEGEDPTMPPDEVDVEDSLKDQ